MLYDDSTQTGRLLEAVSQGDSSAVSELFRLHLPYLRKIIRLRMSPELASRLDVSDVVQETQMVVARKLREFVEKRPSSFRIWLRSRAINQLTDEYRRHIKAERRSVRREQAFNENSSREIAHALVTDSPSKRLHRAEVTSRLRELIGRLKKIDREALTMRHGEGLSNGEVAEVLNIPLATARKRYGRALRRLVELVAKEGLEASLFLDNS